MLDKPVDEIVTEGGKLVGVRAGSDIARCNMVICDPTYAQDRCRKVGQVRFAIYLCSCLATYICFPLVISNYSCVAAIYGMKCPFVCMWLTY